MTTRKRKKSQSQQTPKSQPRKQARPRARKATKRKAASTSKNGKRKGKASTPSKRKAKASTPSKRKASAPSKRKTSAPSKQKTSAPSKRKAKASAPTRGQTSAPSKRKASAPTRSAAAKKAAETRRRNEAAQAKKRAQAAKKAAETRAKNKAAAQALHEKRSLAAKKAAETRRIKAQAAQVIDLRKAADQAKARQTKLELDREADRKSALVREASERWEREEAVRVKEKEARLIERKKDFRRWFRIEPAKPTKEPPSDEEMAELRTLMRDIEYRFSPPIEVVHSAFIYADNTVDARMRFTGFGDDFKGLINALSAIFLEEIVPNYKLLETWWVRIRLETEDRESKFRSIIRITETDPTRKFGKQTRRINVTRRIKRAAATFEAAKNEGGRIAEEAGEDVVAVILWFYRTRQEY